VAAQNISMFHRPQAFGPSCHPATFLVQVSWTCVRGIRPTADGERKFKRLNFRV